MTIRTISLVALLFCAPVLWAQAEGSLVNQSALPPQRADTHLFFYDGSGRIAYECWAASIANISTFGVLASTNATPIEVQTDSAHGLQDGALVTNSQIGGNLAANGIFQIVVTAADKFTLKDRAAGTNVAGTGAFVAGTGKVETNAPRTNANQWAILVYQYDVVTGKITSKKWAEGGATRTLSCDSRALYGRQ